MVFEHKYSTNAIVPFFLNFLIGFGSGAFLQGDYTTAYIQLGIDIGTIVLLLSGATIGLTAPSGSEPTTQWTIGITLIGIGLTTFAGNRIYEMIRPWKFANKTNKKLNEALYSNTTQISLFPLISNNSVGLSLNFKI